jgi:hypothetical protein
MAYPKPVDIAAVIDRLASDPLRLAGARGRVQEWATAHSWEALAPLWRAELERAT